MSSYRAFGPSVITSGGSMTGTATLDSKAIDVESFQSFSFQAVWTGTPTGTFSVQVSNDGVNFSDLGAAAPSNPAGSGGSTILLCYGVPVKWAKLRYVNASGTGSLTTTCVGKSR